MQVLCNQTLTKCKFCKPFVLIIIHLMGGVCIPFSFLLGTVHVGPGTGWSRHGRRVRLSLRFSSRVGICRGRSILSIILNGLPRWKLARPLFASDISLVLY